MASKNVDYPKGEDATIDTFASEKNLKESIRDGVRTALGCEDISPTLSGLRLKEIFDAPYHGRNGPPAHDLANGYNESPLTDPARLTIGEACVEYVNEHLDDAEPESIYMFTTFLLDTNLLKDYPSLLSALVIFFSKRFPEVDRYWELMRIFINEEYATLWWSELPSDYATSSLSKGFYDTMLLFHDFIPEKVSIQDLSAYRGQLEKKEIEKN